MLITTFSTVATFGLTEAHMVFENVTQVRVCVEQRSPAKGCAVEFPFSVNLNISRERSTTGKYVR